MSVPKTTTGKSARYAVQLSSVLPLPRITKTWLPEPQLPGSVTVTLCSRLPAVLTSKTMRQLPPVTFRCITVLPPELRSMPFERLPRSSTTSGRPTRTERAKPTLRASEVTTALRDNQVYLWRVRAVNASGGAGDWSEIGMFYVDLGSKGCHCAANAVPPLAVLTVVWLVRFRRSRRRA